MAEFQKVMRDKERMCSARADIPVCRECSLRKKVNKMNITCTEFIEKYPAEAEQIIEDWSDKNPVMTNADKCKEVFGHDLRTSCYADKITLNNCDFNCKSCPYYADAEYNAPEGSENV